MYFIFRGSWPPCLSCFSQYLYLVAREFGLLSYFTQNPPGQRAATEALGVGWLSTRTPSVDLPCMDKNGHMTAGMSCNIIRALLAEVLGTKLPESVNVSVSRGNLKGGAPRQLTDSYTCCMLYKHI
jgi:hypothetical protein